MNKKSIAPRRLTAALLTAALMACVLPAVQADTALQRTAVCKGLHHEVKEAMRTMSACITMDNPPAACGRQGMDVQRFENNENKLPKARHAQEYWEGKLRNGPNAGTWRLVYLVTMGRSKNKVDARYFTKDHYQTFCQIN